MKRDNVGFAPAKENAWKKLNASPVDWSLMKLITKLAAVFIVLAIVAIAISTNT